MNNHVTFKSFKVLFLSRACMNICTTLHDPSSFEDSDSYDKERTFQLGRVNSYNLLWLYKSDTIDVHDTGMRSQCLTPV